MGRKLGFHVTASLVASVALLAGCNADAPPPLETTASNEAPIAVAPSPKAQAVLDDLRARFKVKLAEPTSSTDETRVTRTYEVLLASDADRIDAVSTSLAPHLASPAKGTAKTPYLALPRTATGVARVSEQASGLYVDVQPAGLAAAPAEVADGYVVYASARSSKEHLLRRITADGLEDFENFESAPASPDVSYELGLSPKVAGLRLVGNSLEILDSTGTPRLRIPSPYLVDSAGARTDATLAVVGCNVDVSPAAPWDRAVTAPGASHCTLKVSWDGSKVTYPALLDPSWTTTGSMPNTQADHKGILLATGKTLVIGPYFGNGCYLYDPASGTWSTTGSPASSRSNAVAVRLQDGKVLLAGGSSSGGTQSTAELYNPASGTWASTGAMVSKIESGTADVLANGKVLLAGGFKYVSSSNRNYTAEAELYNPATGTWSLTGSMASAHGWHASGLLPNGKVIVVAGASSWPSQTANLTATIYDATTATWSSAGSLPVGRYRHAATVLPYGGKVLASGGLNPATSARLISTALYDPVANTWSTGPVMSIERVYHAAILLPNSKVLLAGGETTAGRTSGVDIYDPQTNTITATSSMSIPRSNFSVTVAGDPATTWPVLVAGGYTPPNNSTTATAELFDVRQPPASGTQLGDPQGLPAVTVTWAGNINPKGTVALSSSLAAFATNNTDSTRYIHVDLVATGLDDRAVRRADYANLTLAPMSSQSFSVTVGDFPVQSIGTESEVVLSAREYTPAGGDTGLVVPSTQLYYELASGYSNTILHGIDGKDLDRTQPSQSTTQGQLLASMQTMQQGLLTRQGRLFDASTGGWTDVTTLAMPGTAPFSYSQGYIGRGQWAKDANDLKPGFTLSYTPPPGAPNRIVCADWRARYVDANGLDDYLKVQSPNDPDPKKASITTNHARYASAFLTTAPSAGAADMVWSGYLDANGCVTQQLGQGAYDLFWFSDMKQGSTNIKLTLGGNGMSGTTGTGFTYPATPPFAVVTFYFPDNSFTLDSYVLAAWNEDFVTRVASVMSQLLSTTDTGLLPGATYVAEVNNGCTPWDIDAGTYADADPLGGCFDTTVQSPTFDKFLVGYAKNQGTNQWEHSTLWRDIIAHEFGHNIHLKLLLAPPATTGFAAFYYDYDRLNPQADTPDTVQNYACRCSYVQGTNRIHCMQSRERQGMASVEGFAHFYAARMFNNAAESDCSFTYYKDALIQSDLGYVPRSPPRSIDCFHQKWMEGTCNSPPGLGIARMGNEWDWFDFYYKINKKLTSTYTLDEIGRIQRRACFSEAFSCGGQGVLFSSVGGGFLNLRGQNVPFANMSLADAACLVAGGGSCIPSLGKYTDFVNAGLVYGIDQ